MQEARPSADIGTQEALRAVAREFDPTGAIISVRAHGSGNVNDTYLVESSTGRRFILQRINTRVFRRPELVMSNMRTVVEHITERLREPGSADRRFEMPQVLATRGGSDHHTDGSGSFWRAMSFIENSVSSRTIRDADHAREVGFALGMFHSLISDLPARGLADTLEGFHVTPRYLVRYDAALAARPSLDSPEVRHCKGFVEKRRALAPVLEDALRSGILGLAPIHGDPKVNNVMIDTRTGLAASIIDLDTVKPGLVHYDIGDCLRSGCNPTGEDTADLGAIQFEPDLCRAILEGYLSRAGSFLTRNDRAFIYDSVRLIAFELGLRFFTDYLEGDVYFKVRYEGHNLWRALVQFKLVESIESQRGSIRAIIEDLL